MTTLGNYLLVSGILFSIGFAGVMLRRNLIVIQDNEIPDWLVGRISIPADREVMLSFEPPNICTADL